MGKQAGVDELFEGRHFDREVIILCVRWYLRFKLSLRDLLEMMAERGLSLAHTTHARCRLWHRPVSPSRTTSTIESVTSGSVLWVGIDVDISAMASDRPVQTNHTDRG
jgi:transposase-like protein